MKLFKLALILYCFGILESCGSINVKQNFEGVIYSEVTYTSKIESLSAEQIYGQAKSTDVTYIKDGFYKVNSSTDFMNFMLWRHLDTTLYFTHLSSPDTLWYDYTNSHPSEISEFNIIKNSDTILNYVCDALVVLDSKNRVFTYYYSSEFSLDPEYYKNASNSAKYEIMKLCKSVYLRLKMESSYGIVDTKATRINKVTLKDKTFDIPEYKVLKEVKY